MTNEQLTAYLQDDSYLYTLSYEELKTLVMQYPYAANLRVLLLSKSYIEQNKDYERNLQMAATYATNRKHLYRLIRRLKQLESAPRNVILGEDYLELAALSDIVKVKGERDLVERADAPNVGAAFSTDMSFEFNAIEEKIGAEVMDIEEVESQSDIVLDFINTTIAIDNQLITQEEFIESENLIKNLPAGRQGTEGVSDFGFEISDAQNSKPKIQNTDEEPVLDLVDDEKKNGISIEKPFVEPANFERLVGDIISKNEPTATETDVELVGSKPLFLEKNEPVVALENLDSLIQQTEEQSWNKVFFNSNNKVLSLEKQSNTSELTFEAMDSLERNLSFSNDIKESVLTDAAFEPKSQNTEVKTQNPKLKTQNPEVETQNSKPKTQNPSVELEIINESKTKIVNAETPKTDAPKVNFTDWLRQFKTASSVVQSTNSNQNSVPKPAEINTEKAVEKTVEVNPSKQPPEHDFAEKQIENIDNQSVTSAKNLRVISLERLSEMFETPQPIPQNLFGLYKEESSKTLPNEAVLPSDNLEKMLHADKENIISDFGSSVSDVEKTIEEPPHFDLGIESFDLDSEEEFEEEDPSEKDKKKKKKKRKMHELAAKSIEEDDDLVSEILADILAAQGHKKQAVAMYEKLCLFFPEKISYFAAKIEKTRIN